ncbi:hypothetical protein [Pseudomonas sp. LRF_L74]|uniref:hypothetical protein n=1 Tax=Pseudomonas sp. LRF_L74 TaxID=3369422 RepID=UPI003F63F360
MRIAFIVFAVLCWVIFIPLLKFYGLWQGTVALTYLSSAVAMLAILVVKQDRFVKGIALVAYGVFISGVIPLFVKGTHDTMPEESKQTLENFSQIIMLACSGAGGSLIAAFADGSSSDREKYSVAERGSDLSQMVSLMAGLVTKVNVLITLLVVLVPVAFVIGLIVG